MCTISFVTQQCIAQALFVNLGVFIVTVFGNVVEKSGDGANSLLSNWCGEALFGFTSSHR